MNPNQGVAAASAGLVDRLAAHRTVGSAPRRELEWLVAHGEFDAFSAGHTVSTPSLPISGMFIVLTGRVSIYLLKGSARHKLAEWKAGDVTGVLPYSRVVTPPGETVVDEPVEMVVIRREFLPEMIRECPELTATLVHVMVDRARFFNTAELHEQKLKSLGKLAAGLAHELNNPAAAITRFAKTLPAGLDAAQSAARAMGAAQPTPAEVEAVRRTTAACLAAPLHHVRSPLEEAEHEAAIEDWLESRGIEAAPAESVAQSPVTLEGLEELARGLRPEVLVPALQCVAADCSIRRLAREIEQASTRIADLVTAVRGFTQVDASDVPRPLDITTGLSQTLAVLQGKARSRSIRVRLAVEDNLPAVRAVGAEINQVWSNLIDNAIDAAPPSGSVEVNAARRGDRVVVRVVDDGGGIPAEIRDRIFDPFFTTKDVGKGTGLGLDIVRRLVTRHDGDIEVDSRPGRTEFTVSLPVANPDVAG